MPVIRPSDRRKLEELKCRYVALEEAQREINAQCEAFIRKYNKTTEGCKELLQVVVAPVKRAFLYDAIRQLAASKAERKEKEA